ncbi:MULTISPECIES: trimeric intracellular cation channel family protein [unclassified Lysobacter]
MNSIITVIDLIGTFAFAISGATLGVRNRLDLFGVLVLSFAAAAAGGITRDLMIGATPPVALTNWHYLAVSCLAGVVTFYRYADIERLHNPVRLFDAAGLALFAVIGTIKALDHGLGPVGAVLLGMLSGIGGGILRDVLVARTPVVFQSDLYAVAAMIGAIVIVVGDFFDLPLVPVMIVSAVLCFGLRYMAIRYDWHLPVAPQREQ